MAEYITKEEAVQELYKVSHRLSDPPIDKAELETIKEFHSIMHKIEQMPTADVVEVVRCKDCIYFQPDFVLTNSGERRPYTKEEKESHFGLVNISKGINCGSRCERYSYWEENCIPVWFNENDFCSYGKRKEPL